MTQDIVALPRHNHLQISNIVETTGKLEKRDFKTIEVRSCGRYH